MNNMLVRVVMRITKPCFEPATEEVRVVLSEKKEFRKWNLEETRVTEYCGGNLFHLEIGLPAHSLRWFKLLVLRVKGREILHVEEFARELRLDTRANMLVMDYNDPAVMTREMKSHLTRTGYPVNIAVRIPSFNHFKPRPGGWVMDHDETTDDEYTRAEYYGCDGKVFCKVRSPRKAAEKPDFTNKQPDNTKENDSEKDTLSAKYVAESGTDNALVKKDNKVKKDEKISTQTHAYVKDKNSMKSGHGSTQLSSVREVICNVSVYSGAPVTYTHKPLCLWDTHDLKLSNDKKTPEHTFSTPGQDSNNNILSMKTDTKANSIDRQKEKKDTTYGVRDNWKFVVPIGIIGGAVGVIGAYMFFRKLV